MSNRLTFAHVVPRRESHEFLAAPSRPGALTAALRWLNGLVADGMDDMPRAMRRDLGLPAAGLSAVPFAYEIERSRVRV